jgi:hypothetical protein
MVVVSSEYMHHVDIIVIISVHKPQDGFDTKTDSLIDRQSQDDLDIHIFHHKCAPKYWNSFNIRSVYAEKRGYVFSSFDKIYETEVTCTCFLVEAISGSSSIKFVNHHGDIKQQEMLNRRHYYHDEL